MIIFNNNLPVEINSQEEFDNFAKDYRIIHAAGGIVSNENDEILMIYRLEKWDFPKAKSKPANNTTRPLFVKWKKKQDSETSPWARPCPARSTLTNCAANRFSKRHIGTR